MREYEEDIKISREFLNICHAQLTILINTFFVQETAIYLTNNNLDKTNLVPIFIYPNTSYNNYIKSLFYLPENFTDRKENDYNQVLEDSLLSQEITRYIPDTSSPHQLILPLIYEDMVLGLFAIKRNTHPWQESEILQIKNIAQTITLARFIEQKEQIKEVKLNQIQQLRSIENDHIDDFLHQLRNPLTAIRTFAKLLLKRLLPDENNYQITQNIIRESDRLKDLIADFNQQWEVRNNDEIIILNENQTSFFLPEKIEKLESLEITNIINPLINSIKFIAEEKNIKVFNQINEPLPLILSNEKALVEILNNLLENAVKYTPNNGKIMIEISQEKQELIIKISDTGYGIPLEDQPHIFERHYRGIQSQGDILGTGLGLSIVKELCNKIGIKISLISPYNWVKNQENQGSQFSLFIPIYTF
ncbi:sensor histidine kinase KdpD [Geminocystis sp. NIES-3709]|uniref:sensor histidine kinase n=1 Tax=Geminocystis sp. NIES-3709 TaxID=1617448 RepID=UPI0005FC5E6F|nr:HAMP domain-containing sensor histidine kinase [Geminocystis sp. NIES-3709]BAQ65439.1 two-component sensor histidine kinase [Geminocystis sp. NIES-3709]